MSEKTNNQVEDPNLNDFKKDTQENDSFLDLPEDEAPDFRKGTNPLLWNAPIYTAVGEIKESSENPNKYWAKWAEEMEKKYKVT